MKVHIDVGDKNETACPSHTLNYTIQGQKDIIGLGERKKHLVFEDHLCRSTLYDQSGSKYLGNECLQISRKLCNSPMAESQSVISHCDLDMLEVSEDSCSIPENGDNDRNDNFTAEVQQAYRIFQSFLLEKHKAVTALFWFPVGDQTANEMSLKTIDDKFVKQEYESITEFVADFRQMLENCYRFHGVDHWISKQAQKLEIILEQKLTLLSRTLREKTALVVTSKGRFGTEDEKAPVGTSTRRRSVPRNLAAISVGGSESIMVQALRLEEQQRAKEEKRQRDLEKKEAGEASAKEVEEWERSLLLLAEPWPIGTMWELPAIGHFLCLAQKALKLPEIVFFELERCLLMPRCSSFLAKIMTSLLCPPHRRITLHRRPALPYRRWEVELRQKVLGWYQSIGRAKDQEACAEHLGLCHRFFWTLGETSPLEEKPFHLLPFNQRVWLLKGLCDNVYETQKDVQDAVLGQPIHECRESILGYDSQENTYIHFPHFCGADLRIYRQSPCLPLEFPLPSFSVKKLQPEIGDRTEENLSPCPEKAGNWESCVRDDGSEESEVYWKVPDKLEFLCKEELPSPQIIEDQPMEVKQCLELKEDKKSIDYEPCLRVGMNCYMGKFPANSLNTHALEASVPLEIGATVKSETSCQSLQCQRHSCPNCFMDSGANPEPHTCLCFLPESDRTASVIFRQTSLSNAVTGKIQSRKKSKKKKKEKLLGVKPGTGKLGLKKLRQARVAKGPMCKSAADLKRKDRRRKQKLGRKFIPKKPQEKSKDQSLQLPTEPSFKLVCTSLDELRDLISKTEDELDELESTKKRCERWYIKREAVKELHITLIRLLNELLPWEPKLLKAFHRNRARLKKESDDFKKHPEYKNFVREEWVASDADGDAYKEGSSSTEISRELKDEDKTERLLKGGPETTDCENHIGNHSFTHVVSRPEVNSSLIDVGPFTRSSKHRLRGMDEDFSLSKKAKIFTDDSVTSESEKNVTSGDQTTAEGHASKTETMSVVSTPLCAFPRRCNPIQALLAKSVGNKVTLISHPQVAVAARTSQFLDKAITAALSTTNPTAVCRPKPQPAPVSIQTQTSTAPSVQKPMQVVYKGPEGLSLVKNNNTPVKFSVQPVIHQKAGENAMQQVIILPTNLLIQKTEEKKAQQQSSIAAVATTKPATHLSITSGFTVTENRIPVQQVSPLKTVTTVMNSSAVSPSLQKPVSCGVSPARKKPAEPSSTLKGSTTSTSATTESNKCDLNQELKTVCIRDSQSILVTTRGGNTGVVKVQTSDNSGASVLTSSPIFTFSPKFPAFLVSKESTVSTSTAQTTTTKLLPVSSLNDDSISFYSAAKSPLKSANLVSSSPLMERLSSTVPFNKDLPLPVSDNASKSAQILIGINSLVPANSQTNASAPSSGWAVQTTASKNIIRLSPNRSQDTTTDPEQSALQKLFVVTSTTNVPASISSITTTSTSSACLGSSVKFMSQSGSACSTVTVAKGLIKSESSPPVTTTSSASEVMKVTPNLGGATGSTSAGTLTEVQGINITGLTARILDKTTVTTKTTDIGTKVRPMLMPNVLAPSTGQMFVQNSNSRPSSCASLNINGPVKVTGSVDGKSVKFSTYDTGHMASSELLSAAQQKTVSNVMSAAISVSDILNNRSELVVSSSAPNIGCSVVGSPFNKGATLPRGVIQDKPLNSTSFSNPFTPIRLPVISTMTRVPQPLALSTTTGKPVPGNPSTGTRSVMASTARPPVNAILGTTTIQEKVVINTTGPIAPGTQLLINNARFVVPAQGLAPGSHVLLISSPTVHPTGQLGTNPVYPAPRVAGTLTPSASVVQGLNMVTPGISSQGSSVRQPAPISAKPEQSVSLNNLLTVVRSPPVTVNSSPPAQLSQVGTTQSSGQQGLTHIVRLPSFLLPGVKEHSAASSCSVTSCSKENITVQSQRCLKSINTPELLQTGPAPKAVATAVKTVMSWPSPVVTMSPMSSTVSRMQTLPVATVPPIGSTITCSQTTCVATASPSINTLLMATCQPVRPVQPRNIKMTVPSNTLLVKSKTQTQVSDEQTTCTSSKLLLSPDGAILNVLKCPALQNLMVTTDKPALGLTSPNSPLDPERNATSDNPEFPNY
ncbi:putative bromodomain-containing protein 10 isoform 1-T1 [Clarias gariepinus]